MPMVETLPSLKAQETPLKLKAVQRKTQQLAIVQLIMSLLGFLYCVIFAQVAACPQYEYPLDLHILLC